MGGQACVFYDGTDFSVDTDVVIFLDADNLKRLKHAIDALQAKVIAVPPFEESYLRRGHAIHFRCEHPEAQDMRLDAMSVMRGVPPFDELWQRRSTAKIEGVFVEMLGLSDLICAKKTQRDKDWVMIRKMVRQHYLRNRREPTESQVVFWLSEGRRADFLIKIAQNFPEIAEQVEKNRALVALARSADTLSLAKALKEEERLEREADREYWKPLKAELEQIRLTRRRKN